MEWHFPKKEPPSQIVVFGIVRAKVRSSFRARKRSCQ